VLAFFKVIDLHVLKDLGFMSSLQSFHHRGWANSHGVPRDTDDRTEDTSEPASTAHALQFVTAGLPVPVSKTIAERGSYVRRGTSISGS
jgi:hypothetical protein